MVRAKHLPLLLPALLGLVFPVGALAAGENDRLNLGKPSGSGAPKVDSGGMFLQMAFALAITLLVIWIIYRGLKAWNKRQSGGIQHSPAVQVISRTEVDRDMTVYVLQLGDTVSVVSRTSQGSTLLREMSLEEAHADGLHLSVNPLGQSIGNIWGEIRSRINKKSQDLQPFSVEDLLDEKTVHVDDLLSAGQEEE